MTFNPAPCGSGIRFRRTDLQGAPEIPARADFVVDTNRSTTIGQGKVVIHTVEHVLAALAAYHIDNLLIDVSNFEPPIGNGSSDVFVEMIEKAGVLPQEMQAKELVISEPVALDDGEGFIVALPFDGYKVSYTLSYPNPPLLQAQFFSFLLTPESFKSQVAPCRTFALYEEISFLMDRGLIRGGSLANAVVVHQNAALSKGGLFFPNEMARHKTLDLIGDFSLCGMRLKGHFIACKTGHPANTRFAALLQQMHTSI